MLSFQTSPDDDTSLELETHLCRILDRPTFSVALQAWKENQLNSNCSSTVCARKGPPISQPLEGKVSGVCGLDI